ncbi:peptide chain release factor 1 [Candidatus Purcelliella pentastirinorum]|uniref:Peptide chain release factor 1 n=1 Tax=Candidatus Purcelliella pentastirinorum TaxID=472834 RepID=A0AAX3N8G8_9ENTR|nr:peptide chain release factor 1 [Candidatus Purcelliella pentastirinorum]WDI78397.1 peptide chain release factor 1 [Candidatus Purcelliella pentastirinorum]WDR80576.1 peptide chain release factor 1 [Candidatus Purcelliella pentastirinorum]
MKNSIISKLIVIKHRYKEIENDLNKIKIINNKNIYKKLSKEYYKLGEIVNYFLIWEKIQKDIKVIKSFLSDDEMFDLAKEELKKNYSYIKIIENKIKLLLIPNCREDIFNCFIEIRAATGGNEAAIFAKELFKMYYKYVELYNWNIKFISICNSDLNGYKEIIFKVIGKGAYGRLKFESGGHRVQRVPATESQGRIHTSTCTVAVMPESSNNEILKINSNDIKVDSYRSSGAGGQHVNTTDSAVRVTHLPTGITVECQDERSQHKNKAKALSVLYARINAIKIAKLRANRDATRRSLLGTGDRSDRNRTYNFHHGRVTDHRINLTLYQLNEIMSGKLDLLIEPILLKYNSDKFVD